MLAQNFKSAADLEISEPEKEALIKTLVLLETGKLVHVPAQTWECLTPASDTGKFTGHFNMNYWCNQHDCGTVACIGGTAQMVGNFKWGDMPAALDELFYPNIIRTEDYVSITPSQASTSLRSYLSTGDARWDLAMALSPQESK